MAAPRRLDPAATPDEDRTGFVRHLAHELKGYLANVRHSAELLADGVLGELTPKQQEVAQIQRQNSFRLQWLTEYLLAFQAWNGRVQRAPAGLKDALERCVQRCRKVAQLRDVRIDVHGASGEAPLDGNALALLLDNLLSHAVKSATRGGAVSVTGAIERDAIVIEVSDDGAPPRAAEQAALLAQLDRDPLGARGPQPAPRGGLAAASAVAAAHGGRIEFVAAKRGSTVRAHLPTGGRHG
jgi:signal transduction histidine kinase